MKKLLLIAALAMVTVLPVAAQNGFDFFNIPRTVVLSTPLNLTNIGTSTLTSTTTNGPIDLSGFVGVASINLMVVSNSTSVTAGVAGSLTATLEQSSDLSTWTALSTCAIANQTSIVYTNLLLGTNYLATNTYLWPGTNTTPTASTAGFATPYTVPANFTGSGAVTVSAGGAYELGINVDACKRYMHIVYSLGGSNVTYTAGAILKGRRAQ